MLVKKKVAVNKDIFQTIHKLQWRGWKIQKDLKILDCLTKDYIYLQKEMGGIKNGNNH